MSEQPSGSIVPEIAILNLEGLGKPLGAYSHLARARATQFAFIAGQVATDRSGAVVGAGDFAAQCAQVFANIATALQAVGGGWRNIVQFTTYLVHSQDIARFAAFRQHEFPRLFPDGAYPPNTLLIVDRLVREELLIEVQAIAAL
jgi:enamine deaminase RidA (YjgF/YER057c/UK114 family)